MYTVIQPDFRDKELVKLLKNAKRAYWFTFVFAMLEFVLFFLLLWLSIYRTNWTYAANYSPDYGTLYDNSSSWEYILTNFIGFAIFVPIMLLFVLMFWRRLELISTINIIFSIIFGVLILISFGVLIYLWSIANKPDQPFNIWNDPYYCIAYWNVSSAKCPNYNIYPGYDLSPDELQPNLGAGILRFVFTLLMIVFVIVNIVYVQFAFLPPVKKLLEREDQEGWRWDLRKYTESVTREPKEAEASPEEGTSSPAEEEEALTTDSSASRKVKFKKSKVTTLPTLRITMPSTYNPKQE